MDDDPTRPGPAPRAPGPEEGDLDALASEVGDVARRISGVVAGTALVLLHAVVGYLTLSLGLVAPMWAVLVLLTAWAVIGVVAWRWRIRHPFLAMLAPFVTVALVLAVVALGGRFLGWSA
ncbi:MAG: hypothetical protein WEB03_00795 [Nitriliruptor sp.]|uniref:hypothetical protein n=1 Tax=Nitriliruptor sp. TaxID=2448056 RepID=UPI00349FE0DC